MRVAIAAALAALLAGCASTPRGNAENACHFAFLAGLTPPFGVIASAALCSFGLELLPDEQEEEDIDV